MKNHPYTEVDEFQRWGAQFKSFDYSKVNFQTNPKFKIPFDAKIATAGSCFAQHISNYLQRVGVKTYRTELPPGYLLETSDEYLTYTRYSARYGNVYTVKQLKNLIDQAFSIIPVIHDYQIDSGVYIDLLRPAFTTLEYESIDEISAQRNFHLQKVREMFENTDIFIFTLGLTEAWKNKEHGYVYPICPGTSVGTFDPNLHGFINFGYEEIKSDLEYCINLLMTKNPKIQIILTVSPVPLAATYQKKNVVVANCHSKSTLRVVADSISEMFDNVDYFPSYDILTSPAASGNYYDFTSRNINTMGVDIAMQHFISSYMQLDLNNKINTSEYKKFEVNCDEEQYGNLLRN